ncbi:efflux RND transporter permease subunit [Thauera linaloolentis]|uniref:RND efflux transporter, permease protein n=1 Tax=Thauera linaloolentis (strain DSM 12138 / JCM 21573 / CCUG 41526 / CIP 105981 / IAM 15112 / NBRC 102519 / 47Lol) TaxID=1123367 RepID=N6Y4J2_THAL4|nr:efflux RND transporter permease subunit [Thauera linaloolentis]ENO86510.1 RND efflux transporter, permease protein [Thauera linaloolentis 47Lol = DSM 12138]MCM8566503.1 efflux RND transporter permease subunit [Thauera linaloolentis]
MNLARTFIRRPVASCLLAIALVLCGLLAYRLLPVAPLPEVEFPSIEVSANLPGASPESMAANVATPLERALGSIAGVTELSSSSSQGAARVRLRFALDRDINAAARDVQAAINAVRGQLPAGMPGNPSYRKVNSTQSPVMVVALSSPSLSPGRLYDLAATILAQKIAQIAGVGEVGVGGAALPAVRVQLNPGMLAHHGIALDDIRSAIADANALQPLGVLEEGDLRWRVGSSDSLRTAADYRDLIVLYRDGAVVRLGDVATVSDATENRYSSGFHNHDPAVLLQVYRQPDANIVATVDAIHAQLPALQALLPADTAMRVVMDRSPGIRATLAEAQFTLLIAAALVIAVVWAFLGDGRAALIPSLAVPVSLIGAFVAMYFQGFSLNNLSLMALIVAAGLVVDDAIVVLENIERHIANGMRPYRAALKGAGEVGFTLLAMNVSLVVVFLSVLFMGGVVERLFREFVITLAAAILVSLAVSLTLTPSLCAHLLRPREARGGGGLAAFGARVSSTLQRGYSTSLDWALRHSAVVLLALAAVIGCNVYLYVAIPKGTLPEQDTGQLRGLVRGDDGFSFQLMQPKIDVYRNHMLADPAVADVVGTSGGTGGISNSWLMVKLKPRAERDASAREVVDRLRNTAPQVPGGMLLLHVDQDIQLRPPFNSSEYEVLLMSPETSALKQWAARLTQAMEDLPELEDVNGYRDEGTQQLSIDIDREAAQRLGVDMRMVGSVLNNSFSQRQVATLYDSLNQYRVVMELDPRYTEHAGVLDELQVITADGQRVPLSAFTSYRNSLSNDRVSHYEQYAVEGVEYALASGVGPEQAMQAIDGAIARLMIPSSLFTRHGGSIQSLDETSQSQPLLILAVLVTVYFVLGILYESTLHPLTILSTLPSAGIGALLALMLSGTEFSLIALLGLFLLIGVVMKNAILMIDFAIDGERNLKLSPHESIRRAAMLRLRPILMTNLAALLGALPLLLGVGEGSELRQPLGIAIVGGLAVSQLLTLYTTPVVYLALDRLRLRCARRTTPAAAP